MRKTKTMICLSTALAMALGVAGLPATALAQKAACLDSTAISTRSASNLVNEADLDEDAQVELAIQRAIAQIPAGASDFEKAVALHNYLMDNCEYDWDDYLGVETHGPSGSYYGALVNKLAVCGGYAMAYQMLCERVGLESKVILSDTHAWDLVKIDGSWYHVDCTWDDTGNVGEQYKYFLLGDDAISSDKDHSSFFVGLHEEVPATSSNLDSCGWRKTFTTAYYNLHGTILHDGAFYYIRGDVDAETELVKWVPSGETVLARGYARDEETTTIRDIAEFDGSIYYTMGNRVYRLNEQGADELVFECNRTDLGGFVVEGNQLFALPPAAPDTFLVATAQHAASCEHEYTAKMKPATATESGYFIDTCNICGHVQTYGIPATGGGPAPAGGSAPSAPSGTVTGDSSTTGGNSVEGSGGAITSGASGGSSQEQGGEGTASDENGSSVLPGSETGDDPSIEPSPGAEQDAPSESAPTQQAAKPAKVKGAKASAKKGAATLSWSKVKGASGYTIAFKTGSGAWKYTSASAKTSSKKITKLKRGKIYLLKVRALAKDAGKTLTGTWSKTVKIRIK